MTRLSVRTPSAAVLILAIMASLSCDGSLNDRPRHLLGNIKVPVEVGPLDMSRAEAATPMNVQPLSGSLIAVVDSYEPLISLISAKTGKVVTSYDRRGRGPGEVQSIGPMQLLSDSTLLVPDPLQGRAITWGFLNGVTRTTPILQSSVPRNVLPSLVGYAGAQRWVSQQQPIAEPRGANATAVSFASTLVLVDSSGSRPVMKLAPRGVVLASTSKGVSRVGLGALAPAAFAMCDSGYIDVDTSGVRRFSTTGVPLGSHRHKLGWVSLQRADKQAYIHAAVSGVNDSRTRTQMSALLESQAARVDRLFVGFYIAPDGSVWMRSRSEKGNAIVQVDHMGVPTQAIAVPPGLAVAQVGIGYFIGMRLTADADMPVFTLFTFTEPSSRHHTRWQCGKQHDY